MSQPAWKCLHFADFFRIFKDETGVYPEEVEIAEEIEDGKFLLFRFPLYRLKFVKGYLVPFSYANDWPHPVSEYQEWFAEDLDKVEESCGVSDEGIANNLCSADPIVRFWAYYDIGSYHGMENFDSYPLTLTEAELDSRWG